MLTRPRHHDVPADAFSAVCATLAEATSDFRPDLVVGIETGGARVAEEMLDGLSRPSYVSVRLQRPATKVKSTLRLGVLVSRLPRWMTDLLRWMEVELRERMLRSRPSPAPLPPSSEVDVDVGLAEAATGAKRVLVVDDTVDSGRTLSAVVRMVARAEPSAEIRTAVLASTWRRPPVRPDYCLMERTLLRLPWSFDAASA